MECCKIEWKAGYYIEYCPLHAAAPDLLEALKCLLWSMETPDALNEHYMAMARTAIAKAGGDDHV